MCVYPQSTRHCPHHSPARSCIRNIDFVFPHDGAYICLHGWMYVLLYTAEKRTMMSLRHGKQSPEQLKRIRSSKDCFPQRLRYTCNSHAILIAHACTKELIHSILVHSRVACACMHACMLEYRACKTTKGLRQKLKIRGTDEKRRVMKRTRRTKTERRTKKSSLSQPQVPARVTTWCVATLHRDL